MKKLSIITASYNSEKTINLTFDSILNQTYNKPFEYIVVDGKSTDNTVQIIIEYENKFKQRNIDFKWISEPDKGIYHAWNKGIRLASGEYVFIIGSDDVFADCNILNLINQLPDFEIAFGKTNYIDDDNLIIKKGVRRKFSFISKFLGMPIDFPSTIFKKSLIDELGGFNENYKISSDYDFILKLINKNVTFTRLNFVVSNFRKSGISSKQVRNSLIEARDIRIDNGIPKSLAYLAYYFKMIKIYE